MIKVIQSCLLAILDFRSAVEKYRCKEVTFFPKRKALRLSP